MQHIRILYDLFLDYQRLPLRTRLRYFAQMIGLLLALASWIVTLEFLVGVLP